MDGVGARRKKQKNFFSIGRLKQTKTLLPSSAGFLLSS